MINADVLCRPPVADQDLQSVLDRSITTAFPDGMKVDRAAQPLLSRAWKKAKGSAASVINNLRGTSLDRPQECPTCGGVMFPEGGES